MNFDIKEFLPYLLNRAADNSSAGFKQEYKSKYGMLLTEWRVVYHLGRFGLMTANEICKKGDLHKTKVSRAISALHKKGFISRETVLEDKRFESLSLTKKGTAVYTDLVFSAEKYQKELTENYTEEETKFLIKALKKMISNGIVRGN